ncbi:MAG: CDP-glycerol glycerophosphotransferase family protein [Planctomycetes bacterium]|nr:CDP-glycerol glycerophosphotransferase family protein [Planctomycetota bacterium]
MVRFARRSRLRSWVQRLRARRRVLFSASSPVSVVVLRPLLEVLARDPRIELFFTGEYRGQDDGRELLACSGLERVEVLRESEAKALRGDLYLCPDNSRAGKACLSRVLTFHGVSFKGRSLVERARWFHRVFLVGPYQRRRLAELGVFPEGDARLQDIGMPKLDRLARGEVDRDAARRSCGAAPREVCVLYAPTWGEHSSLVTMGERLLSELAARGDVKVVVKLHDHHVNPERSAVDWAERVRRLGLQNVVLYEGADVVAPLAAADILISDASSVSQEFCLLDRPILFADVPELFRSERYRDTLDLETWGRRIGITFRAPEEVHAALERSMREPGEFSAPRRAAADDLFYGPGGATRRAVLALYRELRLSDPPLHA